MTNTPNEPNHYTSSLDVSAEGGSLGDRQSSLLPRPTGPGRWYYGLAALVGLIGAAAFIVLLVQGIGEISTGLTRVVVPGTAELELAEPGEYTVFHEYRSVVDGKVYSNPAGIGGLRCTLRAKAASDEVTLTTPTTRSTYTINNREGASLLEFTIDRPGTYVLSAEYDDGRKEPQAVLAVGHGFMGAIFTTVLGGLGIMFGTVAVVVVIVIVTYVKRKKAAARLAQPPPFAS